MIEVILLERIDRLGQMGNVVKVRPGFARNFLLPQKKALRATKANLELFEKQRTQLEAKNNVARDAAQKLGGRMENARLVVIRQASDTGQLYGSVAARDVAEAAQEAGHEINRAQVQIDMPIKTLGLFPVKVKLHPEVTVVITINVARSTEEAVVQAEKGAAVLKASEEKAQVEAAFGVPGSEATEEGEDKPKKRAKKAKAEDDAEAEGEEESKPAKKAKAAKDDGEEPKAKKTKAKK